MKKALRISLISIVVMILLTGCAAKPESTLTAFLDQYKTLTVENAQSLEIAQYFDADYSKDETLGTIDTPDIADSLYVTRLYELLTGFDYVVGDTKISSDNQSAIVNLTITTYPIGQIYSDYIMQAFTKAFEWAFSGVSQEDQEKKMSDLFLEVANGAEKTYTETIEVNLIKANDKWVLASGKKNTALMNALTGGMIEWAENFSEQMKDQ